MRPDVQALIEINVQALIEIISLPLTTLDRRAGLGYVSDMDEAKMEFGSKAWTEKLRSVIEEAVAASTEDVDYSISEVYLDPPAHLRGSDVDLGWHARVGGGRVQFEFTPSADVDVHVAADYASILPLARLVCGDDPSRQAERDRLMGELVGSGKLQVVGDLSKRPSILDHVHDHMAAVTA